MTNQQEMKQAERLAEKFANPATIRQCENELSALFNMINEEAWRAGHRDIEQEYKPSTAVHVTTCVVACWFAGRGMMAQHDALMSSLRGLK